MPQLDVFVFWDVAVTAATGFFACYGLTVLAILPTRLRAAVNRFWLTARYGSSVLIANCLSLR